jgi:hypothetical protein
MKRLMLLAAMAAMVAPAFAASPAGAPAIKFAHTLHDYGRIAFDGGTRIHGFVFYNKGTAPLIIMKTHTSCVCSEVTFPPRPVMPGDSALIRVKYDPSKQKGAFFKTIHVYSNDPANRRAILTIKGEIY